MSRPSEVGIDVCAIGARRMVGTQRYVAVVCKFCAMDSRWRDGLGNKYACIQMDFVSMSVGADANWAVL